MGKDTWKGMNYDYNKNVDYHNEIGHNIFFGNWSLMNMTSYIWQNNSTMMIIEAFSGIFFMNFPFHVSNLQVDENMNYTSLIWKFDTKEE
jgi:hypothetical protein